MPPLNLTKEELAERLISLNSYSTWKKTKAKRININALRSGESSSIINTAISYGSKNGKNEVLV